MTDLRLEKMHEMTKRFYSNGSLEQMTMRQIEMLTLNHLDIVMGAEKIKAIRRREGISQGVLATILNMSSESVKKWEQGKTKPQGAALRLLSLIDRGGIQAVI